MECLYFSFILLSGSFYLFFVRGEGGGGYSNTSWHVFYVGRAPRTPRTNSPR